MAEYPPPNNLEPVSIFNPANYQSLDNGTLTINYITGNFLKYPNAQGTENFQDINVFGISQFNNYAEINTSNTKPLTINYTGAGSSSTALDMVNAGINQSNSTDFTFVNVLNETNILQQKNLNLNGGGMLYLYDSPYNTGSWVRQYCVANEYKFDANLTGVSITIFDLTPTNLTINPVVNFSNTTVGSLTSNAIQPATSDNSNKIPTTSWVQSLVSSIPSSNPPMPYLYAYTTKSGNAPVGFLNINFSTAPTVPQNAYITIKFIFQAEWNTPSTGLNQYYYIYSGIMNIYPNRLPTTSNTSNYLNGAINGTNTAYNYTDPTYAPNGRWYWVENYSNQQAINNTAFTTNPIFIQSTNQSSFKFYIDSPVPVSGNCTQTINIELINKGPNIPITITGLTNFTNYTSTF